ncbi:SDR family NAD(P)-dependent oxidoreductase [Gammaproteobacteria bacterium]|nr:SDR family NAD(P)-dependent oxidoreductase [Gammaproteobacteria bacterium]
METSNKTALVTGGAGFIGSELTRQLAKQVDRVLLVDNLINGRRENLKEVLNEQVQLHVTDVRDIEHMERLLKDTEVVFHLACLGVRHSIHSPRENHDVNATATLNLLVAARKCGVQRFVYVSSSEVYGTAREVPMTEQHPTFPMTVYGGSKLAGESYTRAFNRTYDYPTIVVRPFNAYGPRCHHEGDSGEVIPKFLLRCMAGEPMMIFGDGTQTRDFSFVSDTARGILQSGFSNRAIGKTINLGQGKEISINQLAQQVASVVGLDTANVEHEEPRPGDVLRLYADSTLAQELLDFRPDITLEEGLTRLRDWYEHSGSTPAELLEQEVVRNWGEAS